MRAANPFERGRNQRYSDTHIERLVAGALRSIGREGSLWVKQYRIDGIAPNYAAHTFDFALPELSVVVEADGCQWHNCPACYPGRSRRARDLHLDLAVRAVGWDIWRFWQHEIEGHSDELRGRLRQLISKEAARRG